ncbi:MAG TPA: trigger factor [Candidatus Limnocylindria bacterium]|nr:trigger factor [Candidatus Limnocylindria bacterium]
MATDQPPAEAPARSFTHTVERKSGSIVTLNVEVDAARLERASDRAFQRHVQQAKIPGFRPGKAPRALYERTYGAEHLWEDAAADVVDETFKEIADLEQIDWLDRPEVEVSQLEPGKPLKYTATVPVRPEVALGDPHAAGVTVQPTPITDEQVEQTIAGMREHHAELRPVDRAAAKDDVVTIDLDVTLDGKALPPMGRNAHLELGRDYAIPGLADALVGTKAGETKAFELAFPDDYPDEDLRGKTGAFTATVSQVAEKILPPLDDEFAKTVGVATVADLDKAVRGELAHAAFHEARDDAAEKLLAHLLDTSTVEVPEVLVADELDHLMADLVGRVKEQGLSWEQFLLQARKTEDEIRADWRATAERRAKSLLVLDALAKQENVTISSTELAQEVALTPLAQQDPNALRNPAVLGALARSMRNRKLVDKLIGLDAPDAEQKLIRAAGGPEDLELPHETMPAEQGLVVPPPQAPVPEQSPESREAIRALLKDQ